MKKLIILYLLFMIGPQAITQEAKLVLPIGITNYISTLRYSPDGKLIVTAESGEKSGAIKVWSATTGKLLSEFRDSSGIADARFQADSKRILVFSQSGKLWILDAVTAGILTVINTALAVERAGFSPDGKMIMTFSSDSVVRIWNSATKKIMFRVSMRDRLWDYGFSPGGDKFYVTDMSGLVLVQDLKSNKPVLQLKNSLSKIIFSSDGKRMLLTRIDTIQVWKNGPGLLTLSKEIRSPQRVLEAAFSPDGSKIALASVQTIRVHDASNYSLLYEVKDQLNVYGNDTRICFSPDGNKILIQNKDTSEVRDGNSGALLFYLKGEYYDLDFQSFSPDGKTILALPWNSYIPYIWDARNGMQLTSLAGHTASISSYEISKNGNRALLQYWDKPAKLFDATTGRLTHRFEFARMSPDRSLILAYLKDSTVELLDAETGKALDTIPALRGNRTIARFSHDGKKILAIYIDIGWNEEREGSEENIRIWDIEKDTLLANISIGDSSETHNIDISPDHSKFLTGSSSDGQVRIWDMLSGKLLHTLDLGDFVAEAQFNADGKTILTVSNSIFQIPAIWDVNTGKKIYEYTPEWTNFITTSSDRKKMIVNEYDKPILIRDVSTGVLLRKLNYKYSETRVINFSEDGNEIQIVTNNNRYTSVNLASGKETVQHPGNTQFSATSSVTANGKYFIGTSKDLQKMERWDIAQRKLLFSFFAVDSSDYLVTDGFNHYDGSDDARKMLYFTCGTEIIELDQVKDQLWVPNLAERIMKGDTIRAKTLKELNICGLTPEVEESGTRGDIYSFKITPRRGGLGETILYVNAIEAQRYAPSELKKIPGGYELLVNKKELAAYFVSGAENIISVKANTSDNTISSRGFKVREENTTGIAMPPNLYAVVVGVSDYKGKELDLKYAAKDAMDISVAITAAARKLLNIDGREHVFIYNLNTVAGQQIPEKQSIKKVLEEIGKKATANDILLIFFAGHGVMAGLANADDSKKQFYFLTADASSATAVNAVAEVGISTGELSEWMKPQTIKAQKRILVFDACNSGQAIRDFVKLGKENDGYIAARNDDKNRLIKEIDKLNEKSGLFILSASASDQNAYEMGKYSQGLLTWALLKAIKQEPDILEDGKYLNVGRWFSAAEKTVSELSRETGARQQPQVVSTTNFNIGVVDDEVMAKVVLASEKPMVSPSIFINRNLNDDDLEISQLINTELAAISSRDDSKIIYVTGTSLPGSYSLTGSYEVNGNAVTIIVNVKRNKIRSEPFKISGTKDRLAELVKEVVRVAGELIK